MSYTEPDLMSPAEEQSVIRILNVTLGLALPGCLRVAAELNIADHLADGPLSVTTLAERTGSDPDTDDTDTPVIGELPEPAQSLSATASGNTIITGPQRPETSAGSTSDTLRDNSWSFSADTTPAPLQTESAEQKPRGLTALFAAGREDIPPQAAPDSVPQSAGKTAVTPDPSPDSKVQATMTQPSGQPAIRVKIGRARLSESFSSPVTATLDDGRAVTILGIYFQRNIGLSFNDRTGILHGTPTEYGEFPVRVVWELAPKKRFSSDIHFAVDPGSHSTTPAPAGFPPQQ